jgi:NOL1/NOP2/fmu family ribosome biogenesis protein
MIKVSRQQYEKWIAGQTVLPGEAPPHAELQLARQKRIR